MLEVGPRLARSPLPDRLASLFVQGVEHPSEVGKGAVDHLLELGEPGRGEVEVVLQSSYV